MTIKVRFLAEEEIEKDAELLIAECEQTIGERVRLPVPVTEIATYHLALHLDFADLHKTLQIPMLQGQSDILGALWVDLAPIIHETR